MHGRRRACLLRCLLTAPLALADFINVQEDPRFSAALKEAGDIRAYLASYIGDADSRASHDGGHGWEHTVSVVREEEGVKSAHAVQRTELLDPLVLGDPVLYSSVTSPTNRAVGVAQSYIWLKALADRLFARAALHVPGDLKLEGRLDTEEGLSFIDALVNRPSQLSVEPKTGGGTLPAQPHTAKPSSSVKPLVVRPPTMPTYLARQRCEVCSAVVMRKMAHGPHLCAGMEYYFDTCNDVLVSLLHWQPSLQYWMSTGCMHTAEGAPPKLMKPCAPHAVCSWLISPNYHIPFCPWDASWRAPGVEDLTDFSPAEKPPSAKELVAETVES